MSSEVARKVVEAFQQPVAGQQAELSTREREVLTLLSQGLPDKLIASNMSVSMSTVRFHLGHIYTKLHVRSRMEAALKYSESTALAAARPDKKSS
jgi:DNA-binding NarL/FixJ family response regulator